jgi:hypothetical protein
MSNFTYPFIETGIVCGLFSNFKKKKTVKKKNLQFIALIVACLSVKIVLPSSTKKRKLTNSPTWKKLTF